MLDETNPTVPMNLQLFAEETTFDTDDLFELEGDDLDASDTEITDTETTDDDSSDKSQATSNDTQTETDESAENTDDNDTESESDATSIAGVDGTGGADSSAAAENDKQVLVEQKVKIKYNGKEQEIGLSEAIALAQKGKNYDHVIQERDALRKAPEIALLDEIAKQEGVTRQEVVQRIRANMDRNAIQAMVDAGVPEELAKRQLQTERELAQIKADRRAEDKVKLDAKPWEELAAAYPDLGRPGGKLPESVLEDIKGGSSPLVAYTRYENNQLKAKMAAMEQNSKVKTKAVGSAKPSAPGKQEDDFLSGFSNDY